MNNSNNIRPWHWLTIISLDAPVVALVWQDFLARIFGIGINPAQRVVLGLAVWLGYVADRWLDGRQMKGTGLATLRHTFARKFSKPIAVAWLLIFLGTVLVAVVGLTRREFLAGLLLAATVFAYLGACHQHATLRKFGWLKEPAVATLIAGGSAVFVFARCAAVANTHWLAVSSFALLCLLNCGVVSAWEESIDRQRGQPSLAIRFGLRATHLKQFALGLLALLVVVALVSRAPALALVGTAGAITIACVWLLLVRGSGIALDTRRLLVDATLLSPLLLIPFL